MSKYAYLMALLMMVVGNQAFAGEEEIKCEEGKVYDHELEMCIDAPVEEVPQEEAPAEEYSE